MKKNELKALANKHERTIKSMQFEIDNLRDEKEELSEIIAGQEEMMVGARAIIAYLDHKASSCPEDDD